MVKVLFFISAFLVVFDAAAQTPLPAAYPQPYYPPQPYAQPVPAYSAGQPAYPVQQNIVPVQQPVYPVRRNPFGGGIGGVSMGNAPLPVQKMTAEPVYAPPPPVYRASARKESAAASDATKKKDDNSENIEQKGLKMFNEDDEGKVLRSKRERGNRRYDRMSDARKEDLLQRVILDKDREERRKRFKLKDNGDR